MAACCVIASAAKQSAAGNNLFFDEGELKRFIRPHDAILDIDKFELAIIPDVDIRADGAVFDVDVVPDVARRNDLGSRKMLVSAVVVFPEHDGIGLDEGFG